MSEKKAQLPATIWALGLVSLLMDVSSETIHGLLPVFLVSVLGASYTTVGFIEGVGEATALILKVISGPMSDWWGKRKPLVLLGYSMGALSKPFFAVAATPFMIFTARIFDRIGKGIRGAPRDALIADITPAEMRGRAFGLRQSLDTAGAFIGPLLAIFLMWIFQDHFRTVFWIAAIPGVLAVFVVLFGVKEPEDKPSPIVNRISWDMLQKFDAVFWVVSVVGAFLQLSRFSEAFLILRAQNLGLALSCAPLVLVVMNIVYSFSAYPIGWLSDHIRREWLIVVGFLILCSADVILAFGDSLWALFFGIVMWGLHLGFTQGVLSALVADTCHPSYRGTAFGVFNLFSAGALLIASVTAGLVWDHLGSHYTFLLGGSFALFGIVLFLALYKFWSSAKN